MMTARPLRRDASIGDAIMMGHRRERFARAVRSARAASDSRNALIADCRLLGSVDVRRGSCRLAAKAAMAASIVKAVPLCR